MAKCANCPVSGDTCKAEADSRYGFFCRMAEGGEPSQISNIIAVSQATPPPPAYPPLAEQAVNLVGAVTDWARSGFKMADATEVDRRLAICAACPEFDEPADRCRQCGCHLKAKAKLASSKCPLNKWNT